jgi:putative N6-adenine-specific DNA methylase
MKRNYDLVAKTLVGLEDLLVQEITSAGGKNVKTLNRAVSFTGDKACMYRVNYTCRTALRVLKTIGVFPVRNEHELYYRISQIDWFQYLDEYQTFAVDAFVGNSKITNSHYASLKVKDAIVDLFRRHGGERPSVDIEKPDLRINLHLSGEQCTLSLDSSGESLHKRGYRQQQGEAPINEVLAAGMILLSGWDGSRPFLDPMCGSATMLVEAAMIAKNIPSGYFRQGFGFMLWDDFDRQLWERLKQQSDGRIARQNPEIYGCDVNQRVLTAAAGNVRQAGMNDFVNLKQVAFENSKAPTDLPGVIVTNPPYGERIQKTDLTGFYKSIGDALKKSYSGWEAWLITSDYSALKSVGLRTSRKIKLYNGPLECRFVKYELYDGSRKNRKKLPQ